MPDTVNRWPSSTYRCICFITAAGRELINHVTHGMVITSLASQQLSAFEVQRWQNELNSDNEQIRQLAIDEIALMLKRFSLAGWRPVLGNKTSRTQKTVFHGIHSFTSARCWSLLPPTATNSLRLMLLPNTLSSIPIMRWVFSSGDATDDETVYYRDAHQPCAGFTQRYG